MLKLTQIIKEFSDIVGYKSTHQTSIAFICTNNKQLEEVPFTIAVKIVILRNKCNKKCAKLTPGKFESVHESWLDQLEGQSYVLNRKTQHYVHSL